MQIDGGSSFGFHVSFRKDESKGLASPTTM